MYGEKHADSAGPWLGSFQALSRTGPVVLGEVGPDTVEHGPGSILSENLGGLMSRSEYIVQTLMAIHAKLGGPLPETNSKAQAVSPVPCGGAIGGAIQASRAIGNNLDRADDLLGYLRALIA